MSLQFACRFACLLAGLLLLAAVQPAAAQPRSTIRAAPDAKQDKPAEPISLPVDAQLPKRLAEAAGLILKESWPEALRILQGILDAKEDTFLELRERRKGDGKEVEVLRRLSAKAEANRLIAALPVKGWKEYQIIYGPKADELLKEANKRSDAGLWAAVMFRYLHTKAGLEATHRLAHYFLDRGRDLEAALCFERLLSHREAKVLRADTLFHATLAFRRAGDHQLAERAWKQLVERVGKDGLRIGDRLLSREQLEQELKRLSLSSPQLACMIG